MSINKNLELGLACFFRTPTLLLIHGFDSDSAAYMQHKFSVIFICIYKLKIDLSWWKNFAILLNFCIDIAFNILPFPASSASMALWNSEGRGICTFETLINGKSENLRESNVMFSFKNILYAQIFIEF